MSMEPLTFLLPSKTSSHRTLTMAPGLTATQPHQGPSSNEHALRLVFPDGIKTSGQHPPLYEQLRSYDDFPEEITGATVWDAEDYKRNPERWTHWLTENEIEELSEAADEFRAATIPLTGISKVCLR